MTDAEKIKQLELEVENLRLRIQLLEARPQYVPVPATPVTPVPGVPWRPPTTTTPWPQPMTITPWINTSGSSGALLSGGPEMWDGCSA